MDEFRLEREKGKEGRCAERARVSESERARKRERDRNTTIHLSLLPSKVL